MGECPPDPWISDCTLVADFMHGSRAINDKSPAVQKCIIEHMSY